MAILGRCNFLVSIFFKKACVVGILSLVRAVLAIHIYFRGFGFSEAVKSFARDSAYFIKCVFRPRCLVLCVVFISLFESVPWWVR